MVDCSIAMLDDRSVVGGFFFPTHLTKMATVKLGDFLPPIFGVNIGEHKNIFELPAPRSQII